MNTTQIIQAVVALPTFMLLAWSFQGFVLALGRVQQPFKLGHVDYFNVRIDAVHEEQKMMIKSLDSKIAEIHAGALEDSSIEYFDSCFGAVSAPCNPVQYQSFLECQSKAFVRREGLRATINLKGKM